MADFQVNFKPESLNKVDTQEIKSVFDVFVEKSKRFSDLSLLIKGANELLHSVWSGPAYTEYDSQFDFIFSHVSDIGEALIDITEDLKLAYATYESADDSLYQQMQEASYNSEKAAKKGSSSSTSSGNLKPVLYSTLDTAYIPSMVFQPLPAKPILVSTMGAAYKPDLSYAAMSPKPLLSSCLPCARLLSLLYQTMTAKASLASTIGSAIQSVIDMLTMQSKSDLSSTMGGATTPNMASTPMQRKDSLSSTMSAAEMADLTYPQMSPADVLSSTMGTAEMADLAYPQMSPADVLSSTMGTAEAPDLTYPPLQSVDSLSSTIPGVFTPDLSYSPLPVKPLSVSDLVASLQFLTDYTGAANNLQALKTQLMADSVNQVALSSVLNNLSPEETAMNLGNALIDKIYGTGLDGDQHGQLAALLGNTLYHQMFSAGTGGVNILDTASELANLSSLVDNMPDLNTIAANAASLLIKSDVHEIAHVHNLNPGAVLGTVLQADMPQVSAIDRLVATLPSSIRQMDSHQIASMASQMADASNRSSVESLVQHTISMKSGAGSVLPVTPTQQTVKGMVVSIEAGDFSLSSNAVHQLVNQQVGASCTAEITKIAQVQVNQMARYDFSSMSFPVQSHLGSPVVA